VNFNIMRLLSTRRHVHHATELERRSTWLELFFDLVTVAAVSRLGLLLYADHSVRGVITFFGLFATVWWLWISYSYYADLFDTDDTFDRLTQFVAMLGLSVIAVALPGTETANQSLFILANSGLLAFLGLLYWFTGMQDREARKLCRWYTVGSLLGASIWLSSLAFLGTARYVCWAIAVITNALVSGPIAYAYIKKAPAQVSHMPERFGLFMIIVLGEAILAALNGVAHVRLEGAGLVSAVSGFALAASIWWIYFDHFDGTAITRAITEGKQSQVRSFIYGYGHLLLYAAIIMLGVGIELSIEAAAQGVHAGAPLVSMGTSLMLLSLIGNGYGIRALKAWWPVVGKIAIALILLMLAATDASGTNTSALAALLLVTFIVLEKYALGSAQ
jgi:low temperature requirement protein LtrA